MAITDRPAPRSRFRLAAWLLALAAGLWLFHSTGSPALAPPPVSPSEWSVWAGGRDPLVTTMTLVRLLALALAWYLLVATALGVLVRVARAPRAIRVADLATPAPLRRLLAASVGASLTTAIIVSPPGFGGHGAPAHALVADVAEALPGLGARGVAADDRVDEGSDVLATLPGTSIPLPLELATPELAAPERHTAELAAPDPAAPDLAPPERHTAGELHPPVPGPRAAPGVAPYERPGPAAPGGSATHPAGGDERGRVAVQGERAVVVAAGDSLWSLARDALSTTDGAPPTEAEVARYWLAVIERNRSTLADPDDPDLLFPGDRIVLPLRPDARTGG